MRLIETKETDFNEEVVHILLAKDITYEKAVQIVLKSFISPELPRIIYVNLSDRPSLRLWNLKENNDIVRLIEQNAENFDSSISSWSTPILIANSGAVCKESNLDSKILQNLLKTDYDIIRTKYNVNSTSHKSQQKSNSTGKSQKSITDSRNQDELTHYMRTHKKVRPVRYRSDCKKVSVDQGSPLVASVNSTNEVIPVPSRPDCDRSLEKSSSVEDVETSSDIVIEDGKTIGGSFNDQGVCSKDREEFDRLEEQRDIQTVKSNEKRINKEFKPFLTKKDETRVNKLETGHARVRNNWLEENGEPRDDLQHDGETNVKAERRPNEAVNENEEDWNDDKEDFDDNDHKPGVKDLSNRQQLKLKIKSPKKQNKDVSGNTSGLAKLEIRKNRKRQRRAKTKFTKLSKWDLKQALTPELFKDFPKLRGVEDHGKKFLKDLLKVIDNLESVSRDLIVYPSSRKTKVNKQRHNRRNNETVSQPDYNTSLTESSQPLRQPTEDAARSDGLPSLPRPTRDNIVTSIIPIFTRRQASNTPTTNLTVSVTEEESLRSRIGGRNATSTSLSQTARHPQYADNAVRQRTFSIGWPRNGQEARRMVTYGFFFTGDSDLVRCFQCGIGLKDWSGGDDALREHIKHSPNCPYIKQLIGENQLNTYRERISATNSTRASTTRPSGVGSHVRHPHLATMEARLETFKNWAPDNAQHPERLAEAGLFFTGTNDLCRCFTCDGGLQRWDGEDDPWLEHTRWFPHCRFVLETKGQAYVDLIRAAVARASQEEEENAVRQIDTNALETIDPMTTDAAKKVQEMGYSKAAVLLAVHEFNGLHCNSRDLQFTVEDLVDILTAREKRGEPIPTDDSQAAEGATGGAPGDLNSDPMLENQRLKRILKCEMCQERDCNILFLPCTHHRLCEECAEKVDVCPNCKRKIDEKLKTFMS